MTILEKVANLKGLTEGLALDESTPEGKVIHRMINLLDDIALTVSDLEDTVAVLSEQIDAVDEDLDGLEEYVYGELDDDEFDDEDYYDVQCPACGETICVDSGILEEGSINCPNCDELLEFEIECDCDDCAKPDDDDDDDDD